MKLATFEIGGAEHWGFVLADPNDGSKWVFDPQRIEEMLRLHSQRHAALALRMPPFFGGNSWPTDLVSFLASGDEGMRSLRETISFVERFILQDDRMMLSMAGYRLEDVELRAPIPRPRLLWGLVGNSAQGTRFRDDVDGKIPFTTLLPRGHQRPESSVVGPGQPVVIPETSRYQGFNVELGIIIGRRGRYIAIDEAVDYIAGYTAITDIAHDAYYQIYRGFSGSGYRLWDDSDFLVNATCSWGGKKADTCCAMGPYLVTPDEVGDPYNLLTFTRHSGLTRNRTYTGSMIIGIERTISWYSSFATLYPGDVIHMASMGYDGLLLTEEMPTGPDDEIEVEIENVGVLKNPVVLLSKEDWREPEAKDRSVHESPSVRDLIKQKRTAIPDVNDWDIDAVPNFWTIYCNYRNVLELEGLKPLDFPRFLNAPASALAASPAVVEIPFRTTGLEVGIELACVVGKLATAIKRDEADAHILGYIPMISIWDESFRDAIERPQGQEELYIHKMYCRWADGFNVVSAPVSMADSATRSLDMQLGVNGFGKKTATTADYLAYAAESLEFITRHITLSPGDVVTLGRVGETIAIPREQVRAGIEISGEIAGVGEVSAVLAKP